MNEQKILDTLEYIRNICETYPCEDCPLSNGNICILGEYSPNEWVLNDGKPPKKWNAFKFEDME